MGLTGFVCRGGANATAANGELMLCQTFMHGSGARSRECGCLLECVSVCADVENSTDLYNVATV